MVWLIKSKPRAAVMPGNKGYGNLYSKTKEYYDKMPGRTTMPVKLREQIDKPMPMKIREGMMENVSYN